MINKKCLVFLGLIIRMYKDVLGDSANTTYYDSKLNNDIMNLAIELTKFGGM